MRILLFLATNAAILVVISVVFQIFGSNASCRKTASIWT